MLARRLVEGQVPAPEFCGGSGHAAAGSAAGWPQRPRADPRGSLEESSVCPRGWGVGWGTAGALRGGRGSLDVQPDEKHRCFLITRAEGEGGRRGEEGGPSPRQRRQPGQRPPSHGHQGQLYPRPRAPTSRGLFC